MVVHSATLGAKKLAEMLVVLSKASAAREWMEDGGQQRIQRSIDGRSARSIL